MAHYYQMNNLLLASMNKMICATNANNYVQTIEIINKYGGTEFAAAQLCNKLSQKITKNMKTFLESNESNNLPLFWKSFFDEMQTNNPT